jgi:hypothetical protein
MVIVEMGKVILIMGLPLLHCYILIIWLLKDLYVIEFVVLQTN